MLKSWHRNRELLQLSYNKARWQNNYYSCITTNRDGKTDQKEGKHQKRNSSQHQMERNSPNSSENEEIEAQQELRGTE